MPRARRQLIEKGLVVVETKSPEMTEEEKRTFQEKIERLQKRTCSKALKKG